MTRKLTIESNIRVKPKGRPRFFRGMAITDAKTREFESELRSLFRSLCKEPFEGPLEVRLDCYFQRPKKTDFSYPPRGDCDNMFKSVSDAGNDVLWKDDSQIAKITCTKCWADEDGFVLVVKELIN